MNHRMRTNHKYIISILSLLILGLHLHAQTNIVSNKIETVVIDAGHGGKDPGAIGKTAKEKDLTLAIALKTGNFIPEKMIILLSYLREQISRTKRKRIYLYRFMPIPMQKKMSMARNFGF
jgi:N-acetylmuramoyl-L-alanine amidase